MYQDKSKEELIIEIQKLQQERDFFEISLDVERNERRQTEEAHRLLQFVVDNAGDAILWISPEGKIFDVNTSACHLLGYTRREMLELNIPAIDPDYSSEFWPLHFEELREKGSMNFETVHIAKNGKRIPVEITANYVQLDDQELNCSFVRDITSRKQIERTLKERNEEIETQNEEYAQINEELCQINDELLIAEERTIQSRDNFRIVADFTYDWEYWQNEIGEIVYMSPSCARITGYLPSEFTANPQMLKKIVYTDDVEIFANHISAFHLLEHKNEAEELDFRIIRKDGTLVYINHICRPVYDNLNKYCGRRVSNRDITARKLAEDALHANRANLAAIIENTTDSIWAIDTQYTILYINAVFQNAFLATFGIFLQPGMNMLNSVPEPLKPQWKQRYDRALGNEHFIFEDKVDLGTFIIYFEVTMNPIISNGKVIGASFFSHDITRRKQIEAAKLADMERLQKIASRVPGMVYQYRLRPDGTSCFPYTSEAIEDVFHTTPEAVREDGSKVFANIHPDDYDNMLNSIQFSAQNLTLWQMEYRMKFEDGSVSTYYGSAQPEKEEDGSVLWHGFIENISNSKRMENTLTNIIDKNPMSIQIVDINGYTIKVNAAHTQLFGAIPPPDYTIFNDLMLIQQGFEELLNQVQIGEIVHFPDFYYNAHHVDPSFPDLPIWIRMIVFPLLDNNQKPERFILMHENITQNKLASDKLKESEALYRNLVERLPDGVYKSTHEGKFVDINPALIKMLGYDNKEEMMKINIKTDLYFEPSDRDNIVLMQKHADMDVYRLKKKDGSEIWVEDHGWYNLDENGIILFHEGIMRDITDRKKAEELLIESEFRLARAEKVAKTGNWKLMLRTKQMNASVGASLIYGVENHDLTLTQVQQIPLPEYRDLLDKALLDLITKDIPYQMEFKICRPIDGQIADIYSIAHYDKENKIVFGVIQDITERKQAQRALQASEEKLSTLFSSMTEMVALHEVIFNAQGDAINYRITDCNNAYTIITGVKRENAIGKLATEVYQTDIPPYLHEFTQVGITGVAYEYTTFYAPMDKHFMISVVSPGKNQFATITTDITAIQQIQAAILAKNKELENYLYVASHDLRSPLVNIQGFSQRLQKQANSIQTFLSTLNLEPEMRATLNKITGEDLPKTLNFIFSNITKMDTLINGLLQISRTGRIKMTIKKVDMNQLLKSVIATFNFQITDLFAKVNVENLPDCYGDVNQLNQLFSNIIGNAIKYRHKTRQLVIEISGVTQYNKVIYCVKDTGIGITPRNLDKIWDVFFRVDSAAPEAGEGIGLSLAKRITDKHKGKIWAESEEGRGSQFFIELQKNEFSE